MRKLLIPAAVVALAVMTASFAPRSWSGPEAPLASISTSDLTQAAKHLPLAEPVDAH
ncbi:MAG TPA: hypothetical protein VF744_00425 [Beijerinckiaceae bacterium]